MKREVFSLLDEGKYLYATNNKITKKLVENEYVIIGRDINKIVPLLGRKHNLI